MKPFKTGDLVRHRRCHYTCRITHVRNNGELELTVLSAPEYPDWQQAIDAGNPPRITYGGRLTADYGWRFVPSHHFEKIGE